MSITIKELYEWAVKNKAENLKVYIDERSDMPPYELEEGKIFKSDIDGSEYVML